MIEGQATSRYVRTSAQKAGLVMDLIRGQNVDLALSTLRFARKRIARDIEKVLRSAVANAQQKEGASGDVDRMFVSSCYADQGPSQKRVRPAPMGRAFQIIKRTAHLTVRVVERAEVVTQVAASAPEGATKRARKITTTRTARKTTARRGKKTTKPAAKKTAKTATAKKTAKTATAKKTAKTATAKKTAKPATAKKTAKPATAKKTAKTATAKKTAKTATAKTTKKSTAKKSTD